MYRIISLGAGVQSSTMALMFAHGEFEGRFPLPKAAIFADTGGEPKSVYAWLEQLREFVADAPHPFPIHIVQKVNLEEEILKPRVSKNTGKSYISPAIPAFTLDDRMKKGMMQRQCTRSTKIEPVVAKVRELAEVKRGEKEVVAEQYMGISIDEAQRMKPSRIRWIQNTYPLVDSGISRRDCFDWMEAKGYPRPPRSACVFCPYHSNDEWRRLRNEEPEEFERAVQFEKRLQEAASVENSMIESTLFLHASRQPLDEVDFDEDDGQADMFGNECEGMCGV